MFRLFSFVKHRFVKNDFVILALCSEKESKTSEEHCTADQ
jgi:hypothetical protein